MNSPVRPASRGETGGSSADMYKTMIKILTLLLLIFLVRHSVSNTFAADVTVENNVSVEASTGGNSAKPGETIEGRSSADVQIRTVINGEIITDEKIHKESTGTQVKIEKKITNKIQNENSKYFKNFFRRIFRRFRFW